MNKKYEFTNETIKVDGHILHRIKALIDIPEYFITAGDLGGFIKKEENLSHEGLCWVGDNAKVYENARVYNNAKIHGNAIINGKARVYCDAEVYGNACIWSEAEIFDNAEIYGHARVFSHAQIFDYAQVCDNASICDHAKVYGSTAVFGNAIIHGDAKIYDHARIYGYADIYGNTQIYDITDIYGTAKICNEASIKCNNDYLVVQNIGSRYDSITFFKCTDGHIHVKCGCFDGTIDEFEEKVKVTHEDNKFARRYKLAIEMAKLM